MQARSAATVGFLLLAAVVIIGGAVGFFDWFSGKPSKAKFAKMVAAAMRDAGDDREAIYDSEGFRLVFTRDGEDCGVAFLRNLYDEYCAEPRSDRREFLERIAKGLMSGAKDEPNELSDVEDRLLPVVRERSYYSLAQLHYEAQGGAFPDCPRALLAEHLSLGVVVDEEHAMRSVVQDDLDRWGLTLYEVLEIAKRNLASREFSYAKIGKGTFCSATNDNHDASRLVLLDMIRGWEVDGAHIAMIPNRDYLIVTGSEDAEGLKIMADLAEKTLAGPRPLTGLAFRLDGDDWSPWLPDGSLPLRNRFKTMAVDSFARDYGEQQELLTALNEKRGIDIYVAQLMVFQNNETKKIASTCVWSEGVDSLLPQADSVRFFKGDPNGDGKIVAAGPWENVRGIAGSLMEPTDHYPPRWRVRKFPSDEQLREIGTSDVFE